mmetsp:Transcript_44043/g.70617  ORF Transcript_44043/g.70617 Transcript_44043/m.70617 type:complete len:237 (+) Transcript_44043:26-736(+)
MAVTSVAVDDIVFEGWIEKKSKHSDTYSKRAGVISKDTFFVFKKAKKYNNALDKIPFSKMISLHLPPDDDKLLIIQDEQATYFYRATDKHKWADTMKQQYSALNIVYTPRAASSSSTDDSHPNTSTEITSNPNMMDDELDIILPTFDISLLGYTGNQHQHHMTDSELDTPNIDKCDFSILDEVPFSDMNLVTGYLRALSHSMHAHSLIPEPVQNLCIVFYYERKFDVRRLRIDFDK